MNQASDVSQGTDDMEALFDSIVKESAIRNGKIPDANDVHEVVKELSADQEQTIVTAEAVLSRVGQLTRNLHDSLRALGYDKVIEKTSAAIPDARDRLAYVITMTEQAAERTLNATDIVKPIQDELAQGANALTGQWDELFAGKLSIEEFKQLVAETRSYLGDVPKQTSVTNAQMMEIMMAQDFQDLTGQVIKKTTEIIQTLEHQLVQLLIDHIPHERKTEESGLINGPVISAEGRTDVVTSQIQVDDLLESLGF